jgi:predicted TIM-barrel fold metal-dependent hydrolase
MRHLLKTRLTPGLDSKLRRCLCPGPFDGTLDREPSDTRLKRPAQRRRSDCALTKEGVFARLPALRFLVVEEGLSWVPHVMWRLDKDYKGNRSECPWLTRLPSEYIHDQIRYSTQPLDEPAKPEHLLQLLDMVDAAQTVLFASDYPHWDFDNPQAALTHVPAPLRERICVGNALDLYGDRLLTAHG